MASHSRSITTLVVESPKKGKKLRALRSGILTLAMGPGVGVLPIWVEFVRFRLIWMSLWKVKINIGKMIEFPSKTPRKEIAKRVEMAILELADET